MKSFFYLLLGMELLLLSGCVIVSVERFVYAPTERIPNYRWAKMQVLPRQLRPAEREVLLAPDFSAFSTSYSSQHSFLNVFTRGNRAVVIVSADLEVPGTDVRQSIELNVATTPAPLPRDYGYWGARVPLFRSGLGERNNVDFNQFSAADHLILTVRWRDGDRIVEQRFPLRRVTRKEDVWIT